MNDFQITLSSMQRRLKRGDKKSICEINGCSYTTLAKMFNRKSPTDMSLLETKVFLYVLKLIRKREQDAKKQKDILNKMYNGQDRDNTNDI